MKVAIIDNYDSFTYNLNHLIREIGADTTVMRNDQFALSDLQIYDKIVLSPGPGIPQEAGLLLDIIRTYAGHKPILGVCLGHQAIGEVFGAKLINLTRVFHGVQTEVHRIASDPLFQDLPDTFYVGRYHSWVVSNENLPECFEVTALSNEGHIMALQHRTMDIHGIQFHPESILTPEGKTIVYNFIYK